MYKIINNTVQVPLADLQNNDYKGIEIEKKGRKYAYLNLEQYEDFLAILQDTKFKKGDKVFWFNQKVRGCNIPAKISEQTVNTDRIDVVTKVNLSFGSFGNILNAGTSYYTKETNGNRIGKAYEPYLIKVEDFNRLNGTKF